MPYRLNDKGARIERMVEDALAVLRDHGAIADFVHASANGDLDSRGIDFFIHLRSGVLVPLQCKADIHEALHHLYRYPCVPYVLVMERFSRMRVLAWRRGVAEQLVAILRVRPEIARPCICVVEQAVPERHFNTRWMTARRKAWNAQYVAVLDETIAELLWLVAVAEMELFGSTAMFDGVASR